MTATGIGEGMRTAVLVSGSGTNLQAIIDEVLADRLDIHLCAVLSDRPAALALERARRASVPASAIDFATFDDRDAALAAFAAELDAFEPELVVLAGFMRILPATLVERYTGRMLNVHPSLLPKYPGLDTYRRVLRAGDEWHGSTVHFVTAELDSGPPIIQYRVAVRPQETIDRLRQRVQLGEYRIYPRAIGWLAEGRLALRDGYAELDGKRLEQPVIVDEQ